jgi:hypothetical protein
LSKLRGQPGYRQWGERAIESIHQFGFCKYLQKSCFLETEETPAADHSLADDDVIQEMDLKNLRSRRDALSELQDLLQKGLCGLMDGCGLARGAML